jgi:multiple sugar transport system substrate-binding protein
MTDDHSRYSRRDVLKRGGGVAGVTFIGGLAGCGGNSNGGSSEGANSESFVPGERDFSDASITWYHHESGTLPALQRSAEIWEEQTGGEVSWEIFSPTQLRDTQSTLFSSGSAEQDIAGYPYQAGARFVEGGHLEELDPYLERLDSAWDQDDFIQRVWDIYGKWNGNQYAIPTKFDLWLSFWNKDYFDQAGLDPESGPATWEQLESYAEQLDTSDHAGFDQTWVVGQAELNWLQYLKTWDVDFYDENGYPAFWKEENRDVAIQAIQAWRNITEHSSEGYSTTSFSASTSAFTSGNTAMVQKWHAFAPTMLNPDESQVANALGIGLTPGASGGNRNQMLGGWGAGISAYSDNKEAAFDLLAFTADKENSLRGAKQNGQSSARKSVLNNEEVREAQPWTETALNALEQSFARPKTLGWLPAKTTVGEFVQTMITDRSADVEPALQRVASEVWQISQDNGNSPGDTANQP